MIVKAIKQVYEPKSIYIDMIRQNIDEIFRKKEKRIGEYRIMLYLDNYKPSNEYDDFKVRRLIERIDVYNEIVKIQFFGNITITMDRY